jgi:hypothetical protein
VQPFANFSTVSGGQGNTIGTNTPYATIPGGQNALATNYAQFAYSSGGFGHPGDSQYSLYVLRRTTTGNTPTTLGLDGGNAEISLPANRACAFTIRIVGLSSPGHLCDVFHLRGGATGASGGAEDDWNFSSLGIPERYLNQLGCPFPTVSVSGGKLHVNVTGDGSVNTIRWTATVETTEVAY